MTYRNLEDNLTYHYVQLITEIDELQLPIFKKMK